MNIDELYRRFEIMPQLAEHQLRVGGVGEIMAENWQGECEVKLVTQLCLLHDMGNIVKFDLSDEARKTKMFNRPINLPYWRKLQRQYWKKYGRDAHAATKGILKEAGLESFNRYVDEEMELYFSKAGRKMLERASLPAVILMYADFRVKPEGVVSYGARVKDLEERYGAGQTPRWKNWTKEFEEWIRGKVSINPTEIDETQVRKRWERLRSVRI